MTREICQRCGKVLTIHDPEADGVHTCILRSERACPVCEDLGPVEDDDPPCPFCDSEGAISLPLNAATKARIEEALNP